MIYSPEHVSIPTLLDKAGYSEKGVIMGWMKPSGTGRFHAITNRGVIDLHHDKEENGKHRASKFSFRVEREIKRIMALDLPT